MSLIHLDLWGRTLNMTVKEYTCLPLGELLDLINAYVIHNGEEEAEEETYIPSLK